MQQPLIASQRDHYETRLKVEELRNQQQRYLMRGAAVMILMVVVALGIYIRKCFRRKQKELNEYMELAEDLRHTLYNKEESIGRISEELQLSHAQLDDLRERVDAHEGSVAHMQTQITELFGTYSRLLNNLSETYYENQGSKSAIFKQLDKEIKRINEGNMITELEAILNTNLAAVLAVWGIVQFVQAVFHHESLHTAVTGGFDNPAGFVLALALSLPVGIHLLRLPEHFKWQRLSICVALTTIVLALLLSASRTGYLSALCTGIYAYALCGQRRRRWIGLSLMLVCLSLGLLYLFKQDSADGRSYIASFKVS